MLLTAKHLAAKEKQGMSNPTLENGNQTEEAREGREARREETEAGQEGEAVKKEKPVAERSDKKPK